MDKIKQLVQYSINDQYGNTHGLSVPSRLELMNKINEIISKINTIIYILETNNIINDGTRHNKISV